MDTKAFFTIGYGMYVISSKKEEKINGQIANAVVQITAEPAVLAVSIHRENLTHKYISSSGVLAVSVLSTGFSMKDIGTFGFKSGRQIDKYSQEQYFTGKNGSPILKENCLAYLEGHIIQKVDVETHTIFLAEIDEAGIINDNLEPMTYKYYHEVIKGKSPQNAPTFQKT